MKRKCEEREDKTANERRIWEIYLNFYKKFHEIEQIYKFQSGGGVDLPVRPDCTYVNNPNI